MSEVIKENSNRKIQVLEVFEKLSLREKMDVLRSLLTPELQRQIERELEARAILDEADKLGHKRKRNGWTEEDYRKDFLKVQKDIAQILSRSA